MNKIKFYVNSLLGSGSNSLLAWLAVVSFVFVFIVSLLTWLSGYGGDEAFGDLLWNLTMRALMPESIDAGIGSLPYLLILLLLTLFGIFVLSILISFLSAIIDARVREVSKGIQTFPFDGHTVILGWSSRVPAIVEELVLANESEAQSKIMIASNLEHDELETIVKRFIGSTKNTQLFWRSRKLDTFETFKNLNIKGAKRILILGDDTESTLHLARLKTTISLFNYFDRTGFEIPSVLVESSDENESSSLIAGSKNRVIPVIVSDLPARLIVETIFQPNLPKVYEELLSFEGNEIYISDPVSDLGLTGLSFENASSKFSTCIPIGLLSANEDVLINPKKDKILEPADSLIIIAEDDSLIKVDESDDSAFHQIDTKNKSLISQSQKTQEKLKVHLVGYSHSTTEIVEKLIQTKRCELTLLLEDKARIDHEILTKLEASNANVFSGNIANIDDLSSFGVSSADTVIISNSNLDHPANSDLDIMRSILSMQKIAGDAKSPHVIAELNASDSRDMMAELFDLDFVVSDKIGSKIFAQYVENPHLIDIINALVCSGNHRIIIRQINTETISDFTFGNLRRVSDTIGMVLMGIRYNEDGQVVSVLNPGDNTQIPYKSGSIEGVFIE
ncbi:CASTOR/POLLUX-related putative ion channel [Candidatus Puniceispirillum sp.]|uniref:CASTOR/POLLUX-related putative ion channel n=1 Tax=Candidatus Puniceispirillum sp. TaxID=2026719 RepID=UPI001EB8B2AA|nr:hypothetical protein [Candidatus Puniceispirillum sp.]